MFDELMAQRLERLERETSRRKWDSALGSAGQRSLGEGTPAPPPANEGALVDLLAERFDRLERKYERLEWQLGRIEQSTRSNKRRMLGLLLVATGVALGLGAAWVGWPRRLETLPVHKLIWQRPTTPQPAVRPEHRAAPPRPTVAR